MPLANRAVLPSCLGRRAISEEDQTEENSLTAISHNAVLGTIVQLASLVRHADDIFCDLAEECQVVFEKAESINLRLHALGKKIEQLDSTEVTIPVGTLEKFAAVENHHVAKHGFDCDHFTPEQRPHCIRFSYSLCETTPVHALRGADLYRKDGQSGPFLFKLWPIALRDVLTPLDVAGEEAAPAKSFPALALQRRSKPRKLRERPKTIHSIDQAVLEEAQTLADGQRGGASEAPLGGSLSKSQPSVLVSVDTTGAGFQRMASFRQSQRGLQNIGGTLDRKKRRRTVSGVPSNILQEIEQFEQERRIDRGSHRQYSLDDLDPVDLDARDKVMQQYLLDIDAAREEREEMTYAEQREGRLLKFLPCRRSRSLPRCVQMMAMPLEESNGSTRRSKRFSKSPLASLSRLSLYAKRGQSNRSSRCMDEDGDEIRLESRQTPAVLADSRRYSSNASLGSSNSGQGRTARSLVRRSSRSGSLKRHSLLGEKLRSLVNNTLLRPRPKSLDLDALDYEDSSSPSRIAASSPSVAVTDTRQESERSSSRGRGRKAKKDNSTERSSSLGRITASTSAIENTTSENLPPATSGTSRAVSRESQIGPGSYYYFDSNHTLPRAQARKYDFPWDSLPKDWTTSVKLREISKRRKEDRQSSSGNWSQSNFSSNRQSLESEATKYSSVVGGAHSGSSSRLSQYSQGKDSGRGSPRSLHRSRHELDPGYMGDAASTESVVSATSTTADGSSTVAEGSSCSGDDWLRALAERAASRGDVTSTSAEALAQLSRVTRQNIQSLDFLVPGRKRSSLSSKTPLEMDNESLYSLDQEGFYTSFHTDSGLKWSTADDLDAEGLEEKEDSLTNYDFDNDLMLEPRGMREFKRLHSNSSTSTLGSIIAKDVGLSSTSVSSPDLASLSTAKPKFEKSSFLLESTSLCSQDVSNNEASNQAEEKEGSENLGTLKTRRNQNRPPPPPPPRSSSISSSKPGQCGQDKKDMRKQNSDSSIDSSNCDIAPTSGLPAASSSPDEGSDHETIYARLKLKTSISVHTFPSWCTGLVSDDEDQAIHKTNLLSASHERLHAEASEVQEMFTKGNVGSLLHNSGKSNMSPVILDDLDFPAHSWPRGKKPGSQAPFLQPGILKTPEKERVNNRGGAFYSKTLNFDPVVNFFDARTPHGVQMPLSCLSSSDESGSSPPSGRITHATSIFKETVSPAASSSSMARKPDFEKVHIDRKADISHHGPQMPTSYINECKGSNVNLNDTSLSNLTGSLTSINSLEATNSGRLSTLTGSCSTIALSDIDSSSLTHVSLDEVDGNSTTSPASSTLSLCWDTDGTPNPTPTATPARSRTHPTAQVISSAADSDNTDINNCKNFSSGSSAQNTPTVPNKHPVYTNQLNMIHTNRVPSSADSSSSSASQTPTLTPSHIPSMEPLETAYIPKRKNDSNNNKTSIFQFPEAAGTGSSSFIQNCNSYQVSQRDQPSATHSIPTIPSPSYSRNHRRRSSPVTSISRTDSQFPNDNAYSQHEQRSRRRSGGKDILSPTDSGFGSPSAHTQPKVAVQPFQHIPSSISTSSANTINGSVDQHRTTSKSMPFVKPQLLREARMEGSKFSVRIENKVQKPVNVSNPKEASHGSRHSSQESLSSQKSSYSSTNPLVPKMCKTDLSQPSIRHGTSSESLHSNSSAGRSDSYRVALLAEADQISLIQDKNQAFSGHTRTVRSGSLVEKPTMNNNKTNFERLRSSSLSSNQSHTNSKLSSHRPHLNKSMSAPTTAMNNMNKKNSFQSNSLEPRGSIAEDPVSRADSYRCAMQSSQSAFLHGDIVGRNSSYRLATHDEDDDGIVVNLGSGNSRMDACNMWTGKAGTSRDMRRMGITDVDQLKSIPANSGNGARSSADTQHARKKFGVRPDGAGTSSNLMRQGSGGAAGVTLRDKSSKQQKLQSSSYIRFDPIFESGEDLRGSKESLRPPSIISVRTAMAGSKETLVSDVGSSRGRGESQRGSRSPTRKRSGSQGRRSSAAEDGTRNAGLSIFGSIKTTIKSIGSGKGE